MRKLWKPLLKLVAMLALACLAVGGVLRIFFVDVAIVGHNGMAPTMEAGDTILIWRGAPKDPDMGAVLMCVNPRNPADYVMGRVVGKAGMHIRTLRGQLRIEGSIPDVNWEGEDTFVDTLTQTTDQMQRGTEKLGNVYHSIYVRKGSQTRLPETLVAEGRIFLLGDNRTHVGQDSRYFGQVDPSACRGTIFMRLSPPDESPNELGHGWLDIIP